MLTRLPHTFGKTVETDIPRRCLDAPAAGMLLRSLASRAAEDDTKPFDVSAVIGFKWSPVDAARAYTSEEDLLTELVGRRRRPPRTERRWTRVDLSLHAGLPYRSTTSIPESSVFGAWTAAVVEQADVAFTDVEERNRRIVAVRGGQGDLELRAQCNPDTVFSLSAVAITGFR